MKFEVEYTEHVRRKIVVDAESHYEATNKVMGGDIDHAEALFIDVDVYSVDACRRWVG